MKKTVSNRVALGIVVSLSVVASLTQTASAQDLDSNVLAEVQTTVSWPPVSAGKSRLQIVNDGKVLSIDKDGKSVELANISADLAKNLKEAIDNIQSDKLKAPEGMPCHDAPSTVTVVRQSTGKNLTVWRHAACQTSEPEDGKAYTTARTLNKLDAALSALQVVNQ